LITGVSTSIEDFNPWWRGRKYAEEDPDIVKWREMPVRSVPAEIKEISLEPFSLNFLYGPRQVGKTTLVKLLVLRLLERVEPEAVFYFSCDPLSDYEELLEVLREYLRARRLGQPSYVFLDEVTFVREWYRAVKHLIDAGRLRSSVVTVTGSSSLWVERAAETFPGRRGKGRDGAPAPAQLLRLREGAPARHRGETGLVREARRAFRELPGDRGASRCRSTPARGSGGSRRTSTSRTWTGWCTT